MTHKSLHGAQDLRHDDGRDHSLRSECSSLSAWSQPENPELNPYGRINDARLYTEARCLPLPHFLEPVDSRAWHQAHRVTLRDGSIAICNLDWKYSGDERGLLLQDVSMLLLASCIGRPLFQYHLEDLTCDTPTEMLTTFDPTIAQDYDVERDAWGLLICAMEDGKFVRIGRFTIHAQLGGLRAFQGCGWSAVELI
jgi:hypothetical protein